MSVSVVESIPRDAFAIQEAATIPAEALEVHEADGSAVQVSEGNIPLMVIRPGVGRGRGRHVYEADMLSENAEVFSGWKMYVDHLAPAARRAAGGLPRPVAHAGGRVIRAWWDPLVEADERHDQGAVVAEVRPTPFIRELVENDPELLEASISARATSVRKVERDGRDAWLVEGIEPRGSVDWVTEGGAGGRVASLLESVYHSPTDEEMAVLESLSNEELVEYVRDNRPGVLETLTEGASPEPTPTPEPTRELTPAPEPEREPLDVLREALQSDDGKTLVRGLFEEELEAERDSARAEAEALAERRIELRDLRDTARDLIEASDLPDEFQQELFDRYKLVNGRPTDSLNVMESVTEDGQVEKTAEEVLIEAVNEDVKRQTALVAAASPTRVRGQGPDGADEGGGKTGDEPEPLWRKGLQEAGIDPDEAFKGI